MRWKNLQNCASAESVAPVTVHREAQDRTPADGHPAHCDTVSGEYLGVSQYSDRLYVADVDGLAVGI